VEYVTDVPKFPAARLFKRPVGASSSGLLESSAYLPRSGGARDVFYDTLTLSDAPSQVQCDVVGTVTSTRYAVLVGFVRDRDALAGI